MAFRSHSVVQRTSQPKPVLGAVLLVVLALLAAAAFVPVLPDGWQTQAAQVIAGRDDGVTSAWQRANQAASYRFTADVQQTLIPRAVPSMIGRQDQQLNLHLAGEVQAPHQARISLWTDATSGNAAPVTLIRDGDQTFIQRGGVLEPVANAPNLLVPSAASNFLDYLAAARSIHRAPDSPAAPGTAHYLFEVDTERFVELMVARIMADGSARPAVPALYRTMTGTGELWVNADGLPQRQIINLHLPGASDEFDVRLRLVLDLRDWSGVPPLPRPVLSGEGWRLPGNGASGLALTRDAQLGLLLLGAALLMVLTVALYLRRPRPISVSLTLAVCFSLAFGPTLRVVAQPLAVAPQPSVLEVLGLAQPPATEADEAVAALIADYQQARAAVPNGAECGDGEPGADTDGDTLTDQQEACLGTNVREADSDSDGQPDADEVLGFECAGQTWTTNPLEEDSNADGVADSVEWPLDLAQCDPDNDGVPNVWDDDNDGDWVPDSLDLSASTASGYQTSFDLHLDKGTFTGTTYLELQVQPQNLDHLRYSLTALDWPMGDERGQITQLDQSTDDLRLVPMLQIATNTISQDLADEYGYLVREAGDRKLVYAPLQPMSDGGAPRAFYAKVAYAPADLTEPADLNMRLVWLVQANNDARVGCSERIYVNGTVETLLPTCTLQTTPEVVHVYRDDPFRITGLNVVKSLGFEAAVFGTPETPTEDKWLFQAVMALSAYFLQSDQLPDQPADRTALEEFSARFNDPGTPAELRLTLPTTVTLAAAHTLSSHMDEGLAALGEAVLPGFLNTHFAAQPPEQACRDVDNGAVACATVGIATEYRLGTLDLSQLTLNAQGGYAANLENVALLTQRSLKAVLYEQTAAGAWRAAGLGRTLQLVEGRYHDRYEALLNQLLAKRPDLTIDELRQAAYLPYLIWHAGMVRTVAFDAASLLEAETSLAAQAAVDSIGLALLSVNDLVETITDIKELFGTPDSLTPPSGKIGAAITKVNDFFSAKNQLARKVLGFTGLALWGASLAAGIARIVCQSLEDKACVETVDIVDRVLHGLQVVNFLAEAVDAFGQIEDVTSNVLGAAYKQNFLDEMAGKSGKLAVVGLVLTIGLAWTQFGLIVGFSGGDPIALKLALADAITQTLWAIILFALSFLPFGIGDLLSALFGMIDALLMTIGGNDWSLAAAIRKLFYDIIVYTGIDAENTQFVNSGSSWSEPALGLMPGNTFRIHDHFTGAMILLQAYGTSPLQVSWAQGYFNAQSHAAAVDTLTTRTQRVCVLNGQTLLCENDLTAELALLEPQINAWVTLNHLIDFQYVYKECGLFGVICGDNLTSSGTVPSASALAENATHLYLDILPPTLDALWTWDALTNPDRDGDGLTNEVEAILGTDPEAWDTDGDGLADQFETDVSKTDPLRADSDGDGLTDGLEVQRGYDANTADADGDGLTDGQEAFHFDGGAWVGGWQVTLPGGLTTRVYPDPVNYDADGDELSDSAEQANQLSPFAYNPSSRLVLGIDPLANTPGTLELAAYLKPSQAVTISVSLAAGRSAITEPLALCVPGFLTNLSLAGMGGNHTPAPSSGPCPDGQQLAWDFAGANTLQIGEAFSATLTAQADPVAANTAEGLITGSVTAGGLLLADAVRAVLDVDAPEASIIAPLDGEIIQRPEADTVYVIGVDTDEPSSWVTHLTLDIGPFVTETNTVEPATIVWTLPPDGSYTLTTVATDYLENTSSPDSVQVIVDGTPPTATLSLPNGLYVSPDMSGTIPLDGTASDNLAGLAAVQISFNRQPWQNVVVLDPDVQTLNTNWSFTWSLPGGPEASGTYEVAVRAVDRAGNEAASTRSVVIDLLPPTDQLSTAYYLTTPDVPAQQPLRLSGYTTDLGNVPAAPRPAALEGTVDSLADATVWLQYRTAFDDDSGARLTWLGDINGDARADLAVGLPAADGGAGRVAIIHGRAGNWPVPPEAEAIFDSLSSFVGAPGAGVGALLNSAGDVNGDGFFDVVVGDPANERAFVIFGRGQPLGAGLALTGTTASAQWTVLNTAGLGPLTSVASAGDVNGDGHADLLLGVGGQARLLLGHVAPWYAELDVALETAAILPAAAATGVGDANGDLLSDFVVTANNKAYLVPGSATFTAREARTLALPAAALAEFDSDDATVSLAALGDVNGDQRTDFLYSSGTAPRLVLGRDSGPWTTQALTFAPAADGFLAAPGDVNGDGLDDILLGVSSNDSAYLILGANPFPGAPGVAATLAGVAGAASAPYSVGADLNCDISADLLLLPAQSPAVTPLGFSAGFAPSPFLQPETLPKGEPGPLASGAAVAAANAAELIVDDDGGAGVYTTIQEAVDAAATGDTITVRPGVYAPFTVSGAAKDSLNVVGVHPDAVFIDGGNAAYAVLLQDVVNVTLANMTVHHASALLELENAGIGGATTVGREIQLDRLVLHSFGDHAILTDRVSTVNVARTTIVGGSGSEAYLAVDPLAPPDNLPAWTTLANLPTTATSSHLVWNGTSLYAFVEAPLSFQKYITATNTWAPLSLAPGLTAVHGVAAQTAGLITVLGEASGNEEILVYNASADSWGGGISVPFAPGAGVAMAGNGGVLSYALAGGGSDFYSYDRSTGDWTQLAPLPAPAGEGAALAWSPTNVPNPAALYALRGGNTPGFYRYDVGTDTWTQLDDAPFNVGSGGGLAWSAGLYATAGGSTNAVAYYNDRTEAWTPLDLSGTPVVSTGGSLAGTGSEVYLIYGGGNGFARLGPTPAYPPVKATFDGVAFVGPANAVATAWLSLPGNSLDYDVETVNSQWVGGGVWSPAVAPAEQIAFADALFVRPTAAVYRTELGTALTAGYHTPRADAHVSPTYCASCGNDGRTWGVEAFASLQAAINSGANRVRVHPGLFEETFYLLSGVQVVGSGAEATLITPPVGAGSASIVSAEGIASALLARLTLAGNGTSGGLRIEDGAQAVRLAHNIVRNTGTALSVDGIDTEVEVVNNTLVNNLNGLLASSSAGVDLRNSILAFHSDTALQYQNGAPTQLHVYNDYFGNDVDIRVNGVPQAPDGLGELGVDPLFADPAAHNYRPLSISPVIDAGNPNDPTPPGAGGRVDMGYSEGGQAAFYASPTYCSQCLNDGLIWLIDAFDTIQPALDAAAEYLRDVGCADSALATEHGLCRTRVTVGVDEGDYTEDLSVPSYVQLLGLGAQATRLTGTGQGSVVTFDGVTDAQVSGFAIQGGGSGLGQAGVAAINAAHQITVTRNLINANGQHGVIFAGGASGTVTFNTLVDNAGAGLRSVGANTWATAFNNILADNGSAGLHATAGGGVFGEYNLLNNAVNYLGVTPGQNDLVDVDPQFSSLSTYALQPTSPAVDAAEPWLDVSTFPTGGGQRADLGYFEVTATPLVLLFGRLGSTACYLGNSGVAQVEVGIVPVNDPASPITATLPSEWLTATLLTPGATASYWELDTVPADGLARLYTRATDRAGNAEGAVYDPVTRLFNWYSGAWLGDSTPPVVEILAPFNDQVQPGPAIELIGTASDYIDTRFTVERPYFVLDGEVVPADWVADGWDGTGPRAFRALAAVAGGAHTVRAAAEDTAGQVSLSEARAFSVTEATSGNPLAAFLSPADGGWTNQPALQVNGAASYGTIDANTVKVAVNGGAPITATLDQPGELFTLWSAVVDLSVGTNTLIATPYRGLGAGTPATLTVNLDLTPPSLTTPPSGSLITQTATLAGTASDAQSGLASVEVSVDGGYLWLPAEVTGTDWSLVWQAPPAQQNTTYQLMARAKDLAGNTTTQTWLVIVDNVPPSSFSPVAFNHPIGDFIQGAATLVMTWTEPIDNSGLVTTTAVIDQNSQSLPTEVVAGTSLAASLNTDGAWYAHLSAVDQAGNRISADYGPWFVTTGQRCLNPSRSLLLDGFIDTGAGEWLASERLDDDERPGFESSPVARGVQALYTTWDANALYLGWAGAWWEADGAFYVYLDTGPGGTSQLIAPTTPVNELAFAADYALALTGPSDGTFYQFVEGDWQPQPGLEFASSSLGETEVRLPLAVSALTDVSLLAFALSDEGAVWSVFPTPNPLDGPWPTAYHWQPICDVDEPNANQPRGESVLTRMTSPQSGDTPQAPGSTLHYVITLDNREARTVTQVEATLTASAGLTFQALDGPAELVCSPCVAGSPQWQISLASLPPGAATVFTLTGKLDADLTSLPSVTATLAASVGSLTLPGAAVTHLTDGVAPTVTVLAAEPAVLRPGAVTVLGVADDGDGIGVEVVEVRAAGDDNWQAVTGTSLWAGQLVVPDAPTFVLEARATDRYGQVSPVEVATFSVDNVGPVVTLDLPPVISSTVGAFAPITGAASDPFPAGGQVAQAAVQAGSDAAPWETASGPYPAVNDSQGFALTWPVPVADGAEATFRPRAVDAAGNVTVGEWYTTTIDNVAPVITVTLAVTEVVLSQAAGGAAESPLSLAGLVSDGVGVSAVQVRVYRPDGTVAVVPATLDQGSWSFNLPLSFNSPRGLYALRVEAYDLAGNLRQVGPFDVIVDDEVVAALGEIFLPLVVLGEVKPLPDLVGSLSLAPAETNFAAGDPVTFTVVITNQGAAPASDFWVDLYLNPSPVPVQGGLVWDQVCSLEPCYGIAWHITEPLAPGQSLVLTSLPDSYTSANTRWPGFLAAGTSDVYVYVDVYSDNAAPGGSVTESQEANNRAELHGLVVTGPNPAGGADEAPPGELQER